MKLFITDIDNTLSVGETVSEEVRSACWRLRNAGWDIMIATGRIFGAAKRHMQAAYVTQPAILYDGGRIMSVNGEEIHSTLFDNSIAQKLLAYLWTLPLEIQIAGDEVVRCRESDVETIRFYQHSGVPVFYVEEPIAQGNIYRIGLWIDPQKLSFIEEEIQKNFGGVAEVMAGGAEFLDILPKGVSKGSALDRLVSSMRQRPEVIVAVGDHDNDIEMLRRADVAVVPSNASPRVMPEARVIMPTVPEHGISALADYLLSPSFAPPDKKCSPVYLT